MKVLVVVDMQNDFITGSLGSEAAQKIVSNVIKKIKNVEDRTCIAFTSDTHGSNYSTTEEGKNLPVAHCIEGTDGWEIPDDILDAAHPFKGFITYINKPTFGSVELGRELRYYNDDDDPIESIELVGLCTDICVVSNALLIKAFLPNVPIYVDVACCAGTSPEAHDAAIRTMESCQIHILNKGEEPWR